MIRTVPGGNDCAGGCAGWAWLVGDVPAAGCPSSDRPRNSAAAPRTRISSRDPRTIRPDRLPVGRSSSITSAGGGTGRTGGASSGEDCTATPGPAAVATSDHVDPFHHRTSPAVPSGSGYHPGGGGDCPAPVTG